MKGGCTTLATRRSFAAAAFALSAAYDSAISSWFCGELGSSAPMTTRVYRREMSLKYGCNPQQKAAAVYSLSGRELPFEVLNGTPVRALGPLGGVGTGAMDDADRG